MIIILINIYNKIINNKECVIPIISKIVSISLRNTQSKVDTQTKKKLLFTHFTQRSKDII